MTFEDFCRQNNIVVQYHNFTTKIKGLCMKVDDYYIVAINPKFSYGSQKKTLIHEIIHVMQNHFQCDSCNVGDCEQEVQKMIKEIQFLYL